jgi:hypothetical protein
MAVFFSQAGTGVVFLNENAAGKKKGFLVIYSEKMA